MSDISLSHISSGRIIEQEIYSQQFYVFSSLKVLECMSINLELLFNLSFSRLNNNQIIGILAIKCSVCVKCNIGRYITFTHPDF